MNLVKKGSTNQVLYFLVRLAADGTAATGLAATVFDIQYTRELTAPATKSDGIVGTGGAATHVDNKVFEINATSSPGLYMVCVVDAAFATGVNQVTVELTSATTFAEAKNVQLVDFDLSGTEAAGLSASAEGIISGTATAGTTNSITTGNTDFATDELIGAMVLVTSGTAYGNRSWITASTAAGVWTVSPAFTTAPVNGDNFIAV